VRAKGAAAAKTPGCPLALEDFQPRSMLHVPEHKVARAAFPVIDVHTHLSWSGGLKGTDKVTFLATPAELLAVMDRKNVQTMCNLTAGTGPGWPLHPALRQRVPGRFLSYTEPSWARLQRARLPAEAGGRDREREEAGARGLKVLKTLGLFLRENITSGPLVKVDDPRFDPDVGRLRARGIPVSIHVSDPEAFFLPIDRFNERYDELGHHPTGRSTAATFPRTRRSWPRATACSRGIRARSSSSTTWARRGEPRPSWRDPRSLPPHHGRDRGPHRRAGPAAARLAQVLREVPGPDPVRHGRGAAAGRRRRPAAGLQGRAVRDLLPVPGDGGRVLRLRARAVPPQGRWRIYGWGCRSRS
jgi:hypothetical protein